ncbi:MAG: hypothetical protein WCV91_01455, partial [Candidatus Margulisiibacteriota bacterium]
MKSRFSLSIILFLFCITGFTFAQMSPQQIRYSKKQLNYYQKEVNRLQNKLSKTKNSALRNTIKEKINIDRSRINKIKDQLYQTKKASKPLSIEEKSAKIKNEITKLNAKLPKIKSSREKERIEELIKGYKRTQSALLESIPPLIITKRFIEAPTSEVPSAEAYIPTEAEDTITKAWENKLKASKFKIEIGLDYGYYSGITGVLGEIRAPFKFIVGPAVVSSRITAGLLQNKSGFRYAPVGFDIIINYPPGWITPAESYIGAGLNYPVLTSGRQTGKVGGAVFYGVEGEGFGGTIYCELGYGILRS